MHIPAKDVPVGRFFCTADEPPMNVFIMRLAPQPGDHTITKDTNGLLRRRNGRFAGYPDLQGLDGLCENIWDNSYYTIKGHLLVRLIREDEHEQSVFRF